MSNKNYEIHFDVNQIIKMEFRKMRKSSYQWLPGKTEKSFFGLCKTDYPEGYYDRGVYHTYDGWGCSYYRSKEAMEKDYHIDQDYVAWEYPWVRIYLSHEMSVHRQFQSDENAEIWIGLIKSKTPEKFYEVVQY
jgi:hypothetical protein